MIFHVAGAEMLFMLAGELVEQILRLFAQHVDQHVQTAAVRHAHDHFAGAVFTGVADHFAQHRHQRVAAFQREAFRAGKFRAQITFQPFRRGQLFQKTFFLFVAEGGVAHYRFDTLLDPALLFGIGDMHIFRADRTAVGLLQRVDQFAKRQTIFTDSEGADVEGFLIVRFAQAVKGGIEIRHLLLLPQAQRIEVSVLMSTEAVSVD